MLPVITIASYGESNAKTTIAKAGITVFSMGVMYGDAQAQGTFTAMLGGAAGTITADSISVNTVYYADATCDVNPADGGFTASYCSLEINLANAKVSTNASACADNAGTVSVRNNFV